ILRSLANRHWGLDVATLSQTGIFLISHVLGYGISVYGSCATQAAMQKLNTRVVNPAARLVLGTSRTQRLEALYMESGMQSVFNLYTVRLAAESVPGLQYAHAPALPVRAAEVQDPGDLAALRPACPLTAAITSWTHWAALPVGQPQAEITSGQERRLYHTYAPELQSEAEADRAFAAPAGSCPPWAMEAVKTLESAGWSRHQVQRLTAFRPRSGAFHSVHIHTHELAGTRDEVRSRYKYTGSCDGAHLQSSGRGASAAYLHGARSARVLTGTWGG
ncbi:unnamed protein product, partial [Amoebophrya sp. A120]